MLEITMKNDALYFQIYEEGEKTLEALEYRSRKRKELIYMTPTKRKRRRKKLIWRMKRKEALRELEQTTL
jgi:hypothetical protein